MHSFGKKKRINPRAIHLKVLWDPQGQVGHSLMTQRAYKWDIVFVLKFTGLSQRSLQGILRYSSSYSLKKNTLWFYLCYEHFSCISNRVYSFLFNHTHINLHAYSLILVIFIIAIPFIVVLQNKKHITFLKSKRCHNVPK